VGRGQVGFEYIMIVGFLLFFVGILVAYYNSFSADSSSFVVVDSSLNNFKRVADSVFALGPPASQNVTIIIPQKVDSSRTFVGNSTVQISFYDSNSNLVDSFRSFDYNISGVFPNQTGSFSVKVLALGSSGVEVSFS